MTDQTSRIFCSMALVVGSLLGMAGTFVSSVALRGLLWGLDGIFLVTATALLTIYYFRQNNDLIAAGFLIYVAGQTLVLSTAAMPFAAGRALFGAGTGLWAVSLVLLSLPKVTMLWTRVTGMIAAVLFLIVALRIFMGQPITALTQPLPYFAYPFLVATLIGWAWTILKLRE